MEAKTDQEYQQLLKEDEYMEMLAITGYRGLPSKEMLDTRLSIVKYVSVLWMLFVFKQYLNEIHITYNYEILMKFQSSTQVVNFELLIVFLSFFFNLSFPNNVFPEKKFPSHLIFGSLGGNLIFVEGIFSRISRKEQDSAPILHNRENPG